MTTPLPTNVAATDWNADPDKGAVEHRVWHDRLHAQNPLAPAFPISGHYLFPFLSTNAQAQVLGGLRLHAVTPLLTCTVNAVVINVATAVAGATCRLGLYPTDPQTLRPVASGVEFGTVDCSTTGVKRLVLGSPMELVGLRTYYPAVLPEGTAAANLTTINHSAPSIAGWPQFLPVPTSQHYSGFGSVSTISQGAIPTTPPTLESTRFIPAIFLEVVSVP